MKARFSQDGVTSSEKLPFKTIDQEFLALMYIWYRNFRIV